MPYRTLLVPVLAVLMLAASPSRSADAPELKSDHPQRYTVKQGDTLWGIAERFLKDPWRWPEIWQRNQTIQNPHLIFPGDVLVMGIGDGGPELRVLRRQVVKLSPTIRSEPLEDAIPTIPPSAIQPFLSSPLVVDENELSGSGYVAIGTDDKLAMGRFSAFYARGLPPEESKFYRIFRPGKRFVDPESGEFLGLQAIHVGDAQMLRNGETAKLEVVRSNLEVSPGDRMLPAPDDIGLPYYSPRAPEHDVRGYILDAPGGVAEVGPFAVIVISVGEREGLEPGHVLRVLRDAGFRKDPVTGERYRLPQEQTALVMVFRTFEKVSYGLVMRASEPVHLLDVVESP